MRTLTMAVLLLFALQATKAGAAQADDMSATAPTTQQTPSTTAPQATDNSYRDVYRNQADRILDCFKSGTCSREEVNKLEAEQRYILQTITDARADGVVDQSERAKIKVLQMNASDHITNKKTNGQVEGAKSVLQVRLLNLSERIKRGDIRSNLTSEEKAALRKQYDELQAAYQMAKVDGISDEEEARLLALMDRLSEKIKTQNQDADRKPASVTGAGGNGQGVQ